MKLLSRIWWGEDVPVCWHRLWLTRCGACRAADWLTEVGYWLTPPTGEADRVARRVRERLDAEDAKDADVPYGLVEQLAALRAAEAWLDALGVDQDGAA